MTTKLSERDQYHQVPTLLDDADYQELEDLADDVAAEIDLVGEDAFIQALDARR